MNLQSADSLDGPDAGAFGDKTLARKLLVDPGHDPQKRRFARPVDAEDADLGVGIEGEVDVFQDLFSAWVGLAETLHVINELPRYGDLVFGNPKVRRD
jgi:hypothetical protein